MVRLLRLITGLVVAAFVVGHFSNHALGVVSIEAMDRMRTMGAMWWRSTPGTVLHGPSNRMLNLSFFKDFAVYNATKLQFRAEVYNVTNTPNFVVPNGQLGNPAFGSISGTGNNIPRQMQFAVKYLF